MTNFLDLRTILHVLPYHNQNVLINLYKNHCLYYSGMVTLLIFFSVLNLFSSLDVMLQ